MVDMLSAVLLREARRRAGYTQVELAILAGVTQSVISTYESAQRQPSLSTLLDLIEATGHELSLDVRHPPRRLRSLSGPVGHRVRRHRRELTAMAERHGFSNLRVFGSVARGEDRPDSDVDLLVDVPDGTGLFLLGRARSDLEMVVDAPVDLVPASDLKPEVRRRVQTELIAL
jgi:predicted nucleotidyltransferase/DNA-binding XRE family transcriptional regulator